MAKVPCDLRVCLLCGVVTIKPFCNTCPSDDLVDLGHATTASVNPVFNFWGFTGRFEVEDGT